MMAAEARRWASYAADGQPPEDISMMRTRHILARIRASPSSAAENNADASSCHTAIG